MNKGETSERFPGRTEPNMVAPTEAVDNGIEWISEAQANGEKGVTPRIRHHRRQDTSGSDPA